MSFIEEFQANIEALPNHLRRKYALLRDLDKSLQGVQRQNEQRCEKEIEDMIQRIKAGNVTPDSSLIKFSDDALDEQKHAIRIADEKVALASQAYDLVGILGTVSSFYIKQTVSSVVKVPSVQSILNRIAHSPISSFLLKLGQGLSSGEVTLSYSLDALMR